MRSVGGVIANLLTQRRNLVPRQQGFVLRQWEGNGKNNKNNSLTRGFGSSQSRHSSPAFLQADSSLLDARFAPDDFGNSAVVYSNVVSPDEEVALLTDLKAKMKRRRYERGHWDAVIVQYKEIELMEDVDDGSFSETTRTVLSRIRPLLAQAHFAERKPPSPVVWLPCHAIELSETGELKAHVDSVRFSGALVAGLSLQSSSIMRLKPAPPEEIAKSGGGGGTRDQEGNVQQQQPTTETEKGHVDMLLPPRSLYAMTGPSRYLYTHELLEDNAPFGPSQTPVPREERFSIIFRDSK